MKIHENPLARAGLWRLLVICAFFCALPVRAGEGLDHVTSVKVNGLEAARAVTPPEWHKALGAGGVAQAAELIECTGNMEIEARYPEKRVRLEFFPEENPGFDLEKIQAGKKDAWRQLPLKARLWIYWEDMTRFRDKVLVDGKLIGAELSFAEFARRFPGSAKRETPNVETPPGVKAYVTLLGEGDAEEEMEWPYAPALLFEFREGKLFRLTLWNGIAC
jgi:hypothetical protein